MRTRKTFMIACFVSTLVLCSCKKETKENDTPSDVPVVNQESTVTEEAKDSDYFEEAKALIATLEETHPAFALDAVPESYDAAKEEYLKAAADADLSKDDFLMLTRKYMTSLEDGHTRAYCIGDRDYVDINGTAVGDELWLIDESDAQKHDKITEIGKVKTVDIFSFIDTYFPAENEAAQDQNHTNYVQYKYMLQYAGCQFDEKGIDIVIETEHGTNTVNLQWKNTADLVDDPSAETSVNMESKIMDDILYVDWNSCMPDNPEYNLNVGKLKSALANGITKVIIDMRGNGGGNAGFCRDYLKELGMQGPEYTAVFRHSPLSAEQRGETKTSGTDTYPGDPTCIQNDKIQLVVLVDEETFSAATMLAVLVQDGKLGTVIGRASANSPTCYSDVVQYEMGNSGLMAQMSTSFLSRPDPKADQKMLVPDIETQVGEDSLETAKEFLNK